MNATDKDYQRAMQLYYEAQQSLDDALAHIKRQDKRLAAAEVCARYLDAQGEDYLAPLERAAVDKWIKVRDEQ